MLDSSTEIVTKAKRDKIPLDDMRIQNNGTPGNREST